MPLLILTSFNSVGVFSHPCPTLLQPLPMVPQAEKFAGLIILEAIVKIISAISIALGVQVQLVGSEQCSEHIIWSVIPSLEQKGFLPPCVQRQWSESPALFLSPGDTSENDGAEGWGGEGRGLALSRLL